ncbi:PKD domain-containing protein [Haloplanus pelagicus]|jgi:hypothetical protein|uniref:PKD domain-containing protein n=1 Tax=Haloplanus pelagicus TaxID=2949995 RepID=UPI002041C72F|nr:PKD domain-containing protein [Haloplanus sp. HW8-1]
MSGITLQDFVDASERDFTIPEEASERLNEVLRDLNPVLYGDIPTNLSPTVNGIDVVDSSGPVYEFEVDASDTEDSASQLTYEWQVDGEAVGDDSSTLSYAFQSEGDVDVTVTVTDTGGKSDSETRTVSVSLPDVEDRFTVDTWEFVGPLGQTQSIKYGVSDADGDDDILALRLSIYPGDGSSISRTTSTLTDQDRGAVASLDDEFLYLNGFGKYTAALEAMDLDLYDGPEVDENGNLPNGENFTGGIAAENGEFVTLRETTDNITD